MKIVLSIWMFYKKLIIPAISLSALIAVLVFLNATIFSFKWFGIAYMLVTPMFHYYIYEIRNPNEYYFYYNMGINKLVLWMSTLILSLLIGLMVRIIWAICMLTA